MPAMQTGCRFAKRSSPADRIVAKAPPAISDPRTARYVALLALLALLWSSSFAAIKIGVATIPPLSLAAGRISIAALVLFLIMRAKGGHLPRGTAAWVGVFFIGLFGNALPFFLIGWGEQRIDSGLAAILMAVMPLATLLLTHVFTADEKLTPVKTAGIAVGFGGVALLVGPGALGGLGGNVGHEIAVAVGAVCYAVAATIARRLPPSPPESRGAAVLICATLQMLPITLILDRPWDLVPGASSLAALVYLGLFPTALATVLLFKVIAAKGATFLSLNNYIIPALGVLWGALFLGETVTLREVGALALILAGIAVAGLVPARKSAPEIGRY